MISTSTRLAIASVLFWSMGILLLLFTLVITIPVFFDHHQTAVLLDIPTQLLWVAAYIVVAIALWRRKPAARWWGVGLCVISILYALLLPLVVAIIQIAINGPALILILLPWRAEDIQPAS
jgi:hypothetical protein